MVFASWLAVDKVVNSFLFGHECLKAESICGQAGAARPKTPSAFEYCPLQT